LSDRKNILVTGANGQMGMEFRELAPSYPAHQFHFVSKEELDITDTEKLKEFFSGRSFQYCINCAAYTAVDKAESEREQAMLINGIAMGNLAAVCKDHKTQLIHISTDYVFDGNGCTPYTEETETNPVNYYGYTKLIGEQLALQNDPSTIIIRTSWVYSVYGNNFVKSMIRLMGQQGSIGVVNDQWGCPTFAGDLAETIVRIIENGKWRLETGKSTIFHYCNNGKTTWFEFASTIKDIIGSRCEVYSIASSDYKTAAKRPAYSVLDTRKIRNAFGIRADDWKISLEKCILKYGNQYT
jgi:dTDP-4-dehydrorhamnose reductase